MWNNDSKISLTVKVDRDGILGTASKILLLGEELERETQNLRRMISVEEKEPTD